jgi:hypothetical protein
LFSSPLLSMSWFSFLSLMFLHGVNSLWESTCGRHLQLWWHNFHLLIYSTDWTNATYWRYIQYVLGRVNKHKDAIVNCTMTLCTKQWHLI